MTIINRESFDRKVFSEVFFSLSANPRFDFIFFTKKIEIMSWILRKIIFLMRRHNLNDEASKKKLSDCLGSPEKIISNGRPLVESWVDAAKTIVFSSVWSPRGHKGEVAEENIDKSEVLKEFVHDAAKSLMDKTMTYFDFFTEQEKVFRQASAKRKL